MEIEVDLNPYIMCTCCAGEGWVEEPKSMRCPRCEGSGEEPKKKKKVALTVSQHRALVWLSENQPAAWEDFQDDFGLNPEEPGELRELGLADYRDSYFSVSQIGGNCLSQLKHHLVP